jgi:hypothetical protein
MGSYFNILLTIVLFVPTAAQLGDDVQEAVSLAKSFADFEQAHAASIARRSAGEQGGRRIAAEVTMLAGRTSPRLQGQCEASAFWLA